MGQTRPDEVMVTFKAKEKNLGEIFVTISDVADISIAYSSSLVDKNQLFTTYPLNKTVGTVLDELLKETMLSYKIIGDQIVIIKDEYKFAPDFLTISGTVKDRETGEYLPYASVYLYDRSVGTEANEYGFYSIKLPNGLKRIYATFLGYEKLIKEIKLVKDTIIDLGLKPQAMLNEVLIIDHSFDIPDEKTSSSTQLPIDRMMSIASLGGEADLIRLAQMSPGVSAGADGFGGVNVRGGSADQNLILLDGVPLYSTGHAFGIFSIFNPNTIKSAELITGGIPARYGRRLSSVLDIRTKDGNVQKAGGDISLGVLALKATLEGPLSKNNSSYILSFRRTFVDPWIGNISEYINDINGRNGKAKYYFLDFNGKINLKLNEKHRLIFGFYKGLDVFDNSVSSVSSDNTEVIEDLKVNHWQGGNDLAMLRLNSKLSQNLFVKSTLYLSQFDFSSFDYKRIIETDLVENIYYNTGFYKSNIRDIGVKIDFDFIPNTTHLLRFGVDMVNHKFKPGLISFNEGDQIVQGRELITQRILEAILVEPEIVGNEVSVYFEDEVNINKNIKANIGVHANLIQTENKVYNSLQPRFSLMYQANPFYGKIGYSRTNQYLHLISNTGLGIPLEVWLPSNEILKPETAHIYNAGLGFNFDNGFKLSADIYYKTFDNLVSLQEGALSNITENTDWESNIPTGTGEAYGLELNVEKRIGHSIWMTSYTYAKSTRNFQDLNQSDPFNFRFNRLHDFKFAFIQKINKNAEFSMNWLYGSGNPITAPTQLQPYIDINGEQRLIPVYESKNNRLLPDYHRLDISFSFFSDFDWARQRFTFGLYNAYNRKNPAYLDIQNDKDKPDALQLYQYSILPILPSISYSLSF